jgi:hypothetical protein
MKNVYRVICGSCIKPVFEIYFQRLSAALRDTPNNIVVVCLVEHYFSSRALLSREFRIYVYISFLRASSFFEEIKFFPSLLRHCS